MQSVKWFVVAQFLYHRSAPPGFFARGKNLSKITILWRQRVWLKIQTKNAMRLLQKNLFFRGPVSHEDIDHDGNHRYYEDIHIVREHVVVKVNEQDLDEA
jgi:hypothetical protein